MSNEIIPNALSFDNIVTVTVRGHPSFTFAEGFFKNNNNNNNNLKIRGKIIILTGFLSLSNY